MQRITIRLSLALACAAALALTGLSRPRTAMAQANTETTNEFFPISTTQFVPCTAGGGGEAIDLSGTLHLLTHITQNKNHFTLKSQFHLQGFNGTGVSTGDHYSAPIVTQETRTFQLDGFPFTDTFVNNFRLIGQGPGNNFTLHVVNHVTFNNNGEVTAVQTLFDTDCK